MKIYSLEIKAPQLLQAFNTYPVPVHIEGATNLGTWQPYTTTALKNIYEMAAQKQIEISKYLSSALAFLLLSIMSFSFFRKENTNPTETFVFGTILMIGCEYFIMAPREPYNMVQWVVPVIFITQYCTRHFPKMGLVLFVLLATIFYSPIPILSGREYIGELLIVFASTWFVLKPLASISK